MTGERPLGSLSWRGAGFVAIESGSTRRLTIEAGGAAPGATAVLGDANA
jgi:hypothetical protein